MNIGQYLKWKWTDKSDDMYHLWKNVQANKYYFAGKSTETLKGKMNVKWRSWGGEL